MNGFAADVIGTLEQCGLAHDTNGVRADDPRFARSADAWITAVDQWAADPHRTRATSICPRWPMPGPSLPNRYCGRSAP